MGEYMTMSYCYFEGYHKTHLLGGSDSNLQYNVTWHHNYYYKCESRGPLGRQANLHIYNNLVEGQTSYCMSARANCYIYAEYNNFINSKRVSDGNTGGKIKSYNNNFQNCTGTDAGNIVIATSRDQQVSSTNKYANFDTNLDYGYLASGNYSLETDLEAAKADVKANAGPMKATTLTSSGGSSTPENPTTPSEGDYIHNFTENGLSSSFYTITGNLSAKGTVNYNGLALTQCLKMESATSIVFTAPTSGKLVLVFHETGYGNAVAADATIDVDGTRYDVDADNTATIALTAGEHTVKRGSTQIFLYYMFFTPDAPQEHQHSYTESVTAQPGCEDPGLRTYTCTCGDSYTEDIPATGHSYTETLVSPTCTKGGYTSYSCPGCGDSYTDQFVAALGHTTLLQDATDATCDADGYTGDAFCTTCNTIVEEGTLIPAPGHTYGSLVTAPTCTQQGYTVYSCASCGDSYVADYVSATGHSYAAGVCAICGEKDPSYVDPNAKNGLVREEDGNFYYYVNGTLQSQYTGFAENQLGKWYVVNGVVQLSYDGLAIVDGVGYLLKAGTVSDFTGISKQEGVYYYFAEGVNDLVLEGLVYCNGMKAYVQNGEVNFNKSGVVEDGGKLVYVKYGIWRNTFKGLARSDDGNWLYFANGTFDGTYTGVAKLNANWVYVENGTVNFKYSGTVTVGAYDYTVKYGVIQF